MFLCCVFGVRSQWFGRFLPLLTFGRSNQQKRCYHNCWTKHFLSIEEKYSFWYLVVAACVHVQGKIKNNSDFKKEQNIVSFIERENACQELKQFTNGIAIVLLIQLKQNITSIAFNIKTKKNGTIFVFNLEIFNFTWEFFIHFSKHLDTYLIFL